MPAPNFTKYSPPTTDSTCTQDLLKLNKNVDLMKEMPSRIQILDDSLGLYAWSKAGRGQPLGNLPSAKGFLYWELHIHRTEPIKEILSEDNNRLALPYFCTSMSMVMPCCLSDPQSISHDEGITISHLVSQAEEARLQHDHCEERIRRFGPSVVLYPVFRAVTLHGTENCASNAESLHATEETSDADDCYCLDYQYGVGMRENYERLSNAGWKDIWAAYRKARRSGKEFLHGCRYSDSWPVFMHRNRNLIPHDLAKTLNDYEKDARNASRKMPFGRYGDRDTDMSEPEDDFDMTDSTEDEDEE